MSEQRRRRIGGWGFEGVDYPAPGAMMAWLDRAIGAPGPGLAAHAAPPPATTPQPLPALPAELSTEPEDRLAHARGQGLPDVIRMRTGAGLVLPDGVCRPATANQVEATLALCELSAVRVIPWGGGTSVTGGVNLVPGDGPVVSMDLERLAGLLHVDDTASLARFAPGTTGPAVEAALAEHGLTLGHYPQSWELATVGGWVATRSSGQESLAYGRIEHMVAGLELVAPHGRLSLPALPASAAGPDLRQLVMGSEGRLGVITEVTLRVRSRPRQTVVEAALARDLESGLAAARELVTAGVPLSLLRLSDPPETEVAMTVGLADSRAAPVVRALLRLRGLGHGACLLLLGAAGTGDAIASTLACVRSMVRQHRGVVLGRRPGRRWQRDRFHHPYLREGLLEAGYATDTLETAVPWSRVAETRERIAAAIATALHSQSERVAVLCHVSHPYRDGASLYFTFFFRMAGDPEQTLERWAAVKRAAGAAIVEARATISHHHGVGQWHAPWYEAEAGADGLALIEAAARYMDPKGILNPHVLLDPVDRLGM